MSDNIHMSTGICRFVSQDSRAAIKQSQNAKQELQLARIRREAAVEADRRVAAKMAKEEARVAQLIEMIEGSVEAFLSDIEKQVGSQLIDLSIKVSEIILRRQLPDKEMLGRVILEALDPITDLQGANIRLSPTDANTILEARETGGSQKLYERVDIVSDKSLEPGDILIENRNGYFDARISERLKILEERLQERHQDASAITQH